MIKKHNYIINFMYGKIRQCCKRIITYFRKLLYAILFLIIAISIIGILWPRHGSRPSDTLLVRDSMRYVASSERNARVLLLSNIILQHQSMRLEAIVALQSERMQARLSFVAAFALILMALLKQAKSKDRSNVLLLSLILFCGFYYYDIFNADISERDNYTKGYVDNTILALSRISNSDSTWYNIDYSIADAKFESMSEHPFVKKIQKSFRPDISQIVFYFMPLFILIGLYLWIEPDKSKSTIFSK